MLALLTKLALVTDTEARYWIDPEQAPSTSHAHSMFTQDPILLGPLNSSFPINFSTKILPRVEAG
jgi:hypothetical protein